MNSDTSNLEQVIPPTSAGEEVRDQPAGRRLARFFWPEKHRKRRIALVAISLPILLVWLFPPALHRPLGRLRALQTAEDAYAAPIIKQAKMRDHPQFSDDASPEAEAAWLEKYRMGPAAELPLRFDVNRYFDCFTRLRMEDGWVLDYVYSTNHGGAAPCLYARTTDSPKLRDDAAFEEAFGESIKDHGRAAAYLGHIRTDGSDQGFIQLAALRLVGNQFYLYWHGHYMDTEIISRWPAGVQLADDEVTVSLLVTRVNRGLQRHSLTLKRTFPHEIVTERFDTLIEPWIRVRY